MKVRDVVYGAVLTALAILIPIYFGFLRVYIPPFSATMASHVPCMLAMFVSPVVAAVVGLGSTIGFLVSSLPPVIAARAFIHVIFGVVGAYLYRAGMRPVGVLSAALPIHALGESLVVVPFGFRFFVPGEPWYKWPALFVGVGTIPHHIVDSLITMAILALLWAGRLLPRQAGGAARRRAAA
ncbi:MAG: hypothetical protein K6T75_09770 [Acetobacteraceae bacterium]|nr:hypothetical protein [Acetobacteraceae bacterium]